MDYAEIQNLIDSNLASGQKIPALKHREVEHALLNFIQQSASQSGDIKRIKCDLAYYTANFETNGLGKNLRAGWAQCNGNNGTDDLTGRVGVGYGLGYSTFGDTGGSKDAVVVSHSHAGNTNANINYGSGEDVGITVQAISHVTGERITSTTATTGVSGADKNMQPYIVQLYIMKL